MYIVWALPYKRKLHILSVVLIAANFYLQELPSNNITLIRNHNTSKTLNGRCLLSWSTKKTGTVERLDVPLAHRNTLQLADMFYISGTEMKNCFHTMKRRLSFKTDNNCQSFYTRFWRNFKNRKIFCRNFFNKGNHVTHFNSNSLTGNICWN